METRGLLPAERCLHRMFLQIVQAGLHIVQ
jgi:hypothetical protein